MRRLLVILLLILGLTATAWSVAEPLLQQEMVIVPKAFLQLLATKNEELTDEIDRLQHEIYILKIKQGCA